MWKGVLLRSGENFDKMWTSFAKGVYPEEQHDTYRVLTAIRRMIRFGKKRMDGEMRSVYGFDMDKSSRGKRIVCVLCIKQTIFAMYRENPVIYNKLTLGLCRLSYHFY